MLAKIDEQLCQVICKICLELELSLKTNLIYKLNNYGVDKFEIMNGFYSLERDYLQNHYSRESFELINKKYHANTIFELNCEQFVDFVQFGTFERFLIYCLSFGYSKKEQKLISDTILSVLRMRNSAAHNISLIVGLKANTVCNKNRVSAYLGKEGVKSRTLKANMNKEFTSDLLNLLLLYKKMVPDYKCKKVYEAFNLLIENCDENIGYFDKNEFIVSSYKFIKNSINIIFRF